jgi:hypothetical protein
VDYFNSLLGWERFRASQFGIRHHCTIGLNPKEANDVELQREVLDLLPRFLAKDGVVAVGEIGFDSMTKAETDAFSAQLSLAKEHELPVLVHTPHRDKQAGTRERSRSSSAPASRPSRRRRPQQRAHGRRGARDGYGRASRSTRTRRWTSTGWCGSWRARDRRISSTRRATGASRIR